MRILVLSINYWPEQTGIGAVLTRRCEYLAAAGHEVTVCTGMPYYPEWKIRKRYAHKSFVRERRKGVTILRSWMWVPKKVTSLKRIVFEASFIATSFLNVARQQKPDLLFVVSPPLGLGLSAVLLSRWLKIPYVLDVEDLQPDAAADLGMLPKPVLPALYRVEATAYKFATAITTVTEGMRQRIVAKGVPAEKVFVAPSAADSSVFGVGKWIEGHQFREKHGLHDKFIVSHSGNMGVKQGLDVVIEAARQFKQRPDFVFLLSGDGAMKPHLERKTTALGLANVRFLPLQEAADFLHMLAAIDLALIIQQTTVSDIAFPSKTVTLLSAARPVTAAVSQNSEIGRVIQQSQGGVVIEPENADALAGAISELAGDPSRRQSMAASGRRYAIENWHETRVLKDLENHLLKAVGGAASVAANSAAFSLPS